MAKRARTEEAKVEKAQAILDAAARLFETKEFGTIKMAEIAREMGVSNGILFVYYKTKEMLFLQLLLREYEKRLNHMQQLIEQKSLCNYQDMKSLILDEMEYVIEESDIYIRLCAIRGAILEKNIDTEQMVQSKQWLYQRVSEVANSISNKCPCFNAEEIIHIFMVQESILVGCKLCSDLPTEILHIIDEYQLEGFKFAFKENALNTMSYYLDGRYQKMINA